MFENENDAKLVFDYLNSRQANIRLTFETEQDNKISFLGILMKKSPTTFLISVYHKNTYTGLLTNYLLFYVISE